jgi:hypothetical protein
MPSVGLGAVENLLHVSMIGTVHYGDRIDFSKTSGIQGVP